MASLANLKQALIGIREQMLQRPVFYQGTGVMPDDPTYHDEIRRFEDSQARLSLIMREFQSKLIRLQVRRETLWELPRDDRYRAAASVDSQEREISELLQLANDVKNQLIKLAIRNSKFSAGDMSVAAVENVQHQYHLKKGFQHMVEVSSGPVYQPAANAHADTIEGATILVFVALQGVIKAMKAAKARTNL